MTNPVSHHMANVGARVLADCVDSNPRPGAARLIYEAMDRQRLLDEARDRNAATERRRVQNTPWNVPRDDASPG